jgi:hypothetical protein
MALMAKYSFLVIRHDHIEERLSPKGPTKYLSNTHIFDVSRKDLKFIVGSLSKVGEQVVLDELF